MTWFKVDDKLHGHMKAARAGMAAMGMWTIAGSWCADQLTDGFIPDYILNRFDRDAEVLAKALVDAGLWREASRDGDVGWEFANWDEYQPTREDVESRREAERDKKRRQRRNTRGQFTESPRESPGVSRGDNGGSPDTVPSVPSRPDPTRTKGQTLRDVSADAETVADEVARQFEDHFWPTYPKRNGKRIGKAKSLILWRKLTLEQRRRALIGARHYAAADTIPKDPERFLRKDTAGDFPFDDWQTPDQPDTKPPPWEKQLPRTADGTEIPL